jgi:hypothetical protein
MQPSAIIVPKQNNKFAFHLEKAFNVKGRMRKARWGKICK